MNNLIFDDYQHFPRYLIPDLILGIQPSLIHCDLRNGLFYLIGHYKRYPICILPDPLKLGALVKTGLFLRSLFHSLESEELGRWILYLALVYRRDKIIDQLEKLGYSLADDIDLMIRYGLNRRLRSKIKNQKLRIDLILCRAIKFNNFEIINRYWKDDSARSSNEVLIEIIKKGSLKLLRNFFETTRAPTSGWNLQRSIQIACQRKLDHLLLFFIRLTRVLESETLRMLIDSGPIEVLKYLITKKKVEISNIEGFVARGNFDLFRLYFSSRVVPVDRAIVGAFKSRNRNLIDLLWPYLDYNFLVSEDLIRGCIRSNNFVKFWNLSKIYRYDLDRCILVAIEENSLAWIEILSFYGGKITDLAILSAVKYGRLVILDEILKFSSIDRQQLFEYAIENGQESIAIRLSKVNLISFKAFKGAIRQGMNHLISHFFEMDFDRSVQIELLKESWMTQNYRLVKIFENIY